MNNELIAWDGTPEEFWRAVKALVAGTDIESDHAVLSEVLGLAMTHVIDCLEQDPESQYEQALEALVEDGLLEKV